MTKRTVVVIGAGLSGLTAAYRLLESGVDSVVVLEAKPRVGGRTVTEPADAAGPVLDGGATLAYPAHHDLLRLADQLGVASFETNADGRFLYYADGTAYPFEWSGLRGYRWLGAQPLLPVWRLLLSLLARRRRLPMSPEGFVELLRAMRRLDALARTVPPDAPWTAPDAELLDGRSLGSWLAERIRTPDARRLFELFFGYLPPSASFLYTLYFLRTWGGLESLLTSQATVLRFVGGTQAIAHALAESLGDRVVLGAPVHEIDRSETGVVVRAGAREYEADRVIVAVTPSGCRHIRFRPALPSSRTALQEAWTNVHGLKVNAVYDKPFWREAGLSGAAMTDLPAVPDVLDASPPDGGVGVLASYLTVRDDDPATDADTRRTAVLEGYAKLFGPRALEPIRYVEKDWRAEPYSFGCEGGLGPGALTTARTHLRTPVGRVHWAGVETADQWLGFMNGAVRAGERAAREVGSAG